MQQNQSLPQFKVKLDNYESIVSEFQNVQTQLESSCSDQDFENSYDYCIGFLKQYFTDSSLQRNVISNNFNTHSRKSLNNSLIPKMELILSRENQNIS